MAIITIKASKATPTKGIEYITDQGKASLIAHQNLQSGNEAGQMMDTANLWGKAQGENDRKYYHLKLAFHPDDWAKNGGPLTEEEALQIGMEIMRHVSSTAEGIGSVHIDKDHLHFHGIINAVDLESGKLLDMRRGDYAQLKDLTQEICAQHGLTAIDWRQATKDKREREGQSTYPIEETFAEQGLKERGKGVWKDDLRKIIDQAAAGSCSMAEFRSVLESQGVTLTRCTELTISYKLGDHRACRGDTLGGDYTAEAIRSALEHNQQDLLQKGRKRSLDAQIRSAETGSTGRVFNQEERQLLREFGRLAGFKRSDIDEMCDWAPQATWEEKQAVWADYKAARDEFWEDYNIRSRAIQNELDEAYKHRRKAKQMEWVLSPKNRRKSLASVIYAGIFFSRNDGLMITDAKIRQLKLEQEQLRKDMAAFKTTTGEAVETLREKGLSLDAYMAHVKEMQKQADQLHRENAMLDIDQREQAKASKKSGNSSFADGGAGGSR